VYILEVVCNVKDYKDALEHNAQIQNYNMVRKLDLHIHFFNIWLSRNSV
jgi:hypothetical protein